jgi:hypothetical protein
VVYETQPAMQKQTLRATAKEVQGQYLLLCCCVEKRFCHMVFFI